MWFYGGILDYFKVGMTGFADIRNVNIQTIFKNTHRTQNTDTHTLSFPKMESWSMYVLTHQYIVNSFLC